jgi:hypothetical protein
LRNIANAEKKERKKKKHRFLRHKLSCKIPFRVARSFLGTTYQNCKNRLNGYTKIQDGLKIDQTTVNFAKLS